MSFTKTIIGLALSLLLASGTASADWGDVYYCQMTNFNGLTIEGEQKNFKLERFQFKLDQTKNAMVFGSTGYFTDIETELVDDWLNLESWTAKRPYLMITFEGGKFLYTRTGLSMAEIVSADCDKF